jgi:hypothetical protein
VCQCEGGWTGINCLDDSLLEESNGLSARDIGLLVGLLVGGIGLLAAGAAGAFLYYRHKKKNTATAALPDDDK